MKTLPDPKDEEWLRKSCAESNVSRHITDPNVLAQAADLLKRKEAVK